MKLGLGLYRHMLTRKNFRFAKQAGATHIVAHLTDYFKDSPRLPAASSDAPSWGVTENQDRLWTYGELARLRKAINDEGLELGALENFDPSHWSDILLDGPGKKKQLENLKQMIRDIGRARIPIMGYYFSLAGVWGHINGNFARGKAESVGFSGEKIAKETPIPNGQVWNMAYDTKAPPGNIGTVSEEEMWDRLGEFLRTLVPVAEEANVRLAAHPDDPPMPVLRGTGRLIYRPDRYQRLLDIVPSHYNALEFCQGTTAEMRDSDVYAAIEKYCRQGNIAYIHFRNVRGKVPEYREVFLDEGDVDMIRALRIYEKHDFDGVLIPDHTPLMTCDAPWHAGMAFALGYVRAAISIIEGE